CRSWTLDNDTDLLVNAVQLVQDEDSHHSNWVFVPDTSFDGPDGIWPCGDRSYDFYVATGLGGLLYAQSTQAPQEGQKFPDRSAILVPAHPRIISDIHLLNTSGDSNIGHAHLTMYTIGASDLKAELGMFHVEYDALNIPPHASVRYTGNCA